MNGGGWRPGEPSSRILFFVHSRFLLAVGLLFAIGCGDSQVTLTVDLITDWRAGLDFTTAETSLSREADGSGEIRQETFTTTGAEDFLEGVRVAELTDVGGGKSYVRVALRDPASRVIATRSLELDLERSFAATVLITRSCRDVECPAPMGAPDLSECQGGSCVDPRCSPSTPEFCPPPACDNDAECIAALGWCTGDRICADGYCFCRDFPTPEDTGPPDTSPLDTSVPDTAPDTTLPPDCTTDADCGSPTTGAWSACSGFSNTCDETGTRSREVTTPVCNGDNTCGTSTSTETGSCTRDTDGTGCNDGDACTVSDLCSGGSCTGSARNCSDGNACTADSCNSSSGCVNTPMAEHSVCGASYQRCCGGSCVDTRSSEAHCGGCGINCAAGFNCVNYSGRTVCECTANTQCPGGADHICSPTYDYHCGCRNSSVCPGPMTCVDIAGALNYCTY